MNQFYKLKKSIKALIFMFCLVLSFSANSQTFDLTAATTTDGTPALVSETLSGITMTVRTKNNGANNIAIANVGAFGTNQVAFHSSASENSEEMIISFDAPVNVSTIRVISTETQIRTWTFTPTGGTNTAVDKTSTFATSTDVTLGFIGVNSITITSNFTGGLYERMIFDQLTLSASNAAPTATAPSAPSVTEDDTNVALANDIEVADTDADDQTLTFSITGGTLTIGTSGITFGGGGNGSASFTAAGTLSAINTALDAATFTPTPNNSGTNAATISFTTNDGTDTSTAASVSFDIVGVNDKPTASNFTPLPIYQDTPYVFATGNFGYTDVDGDDMVRIVVNSVATNGILYLDADNGDDYDLGEELADGAVVSKANLDNGNLQYYNTNGTSSSFEFVVFDGTVYSASVYTTTLTVTAEPTVSLSLDPSSSISENAGSTSIKASLSHSFNKTVTVNLSKTGTTAGSDYSISSSSILITAGNTSGTSILTGQNDALDEDNETIIIDISSVTNGSESGTQQVTCSITDDDATPTVTFNATSSNASETLGSADLQIDLSAASGRTVTVDYTVTGTATGADYTLADGILTITAGDINDNITIASIVNDLLDENNETVIVTLSSPTNASLGTNMVHTYTINDNDATPSLAFNATSSNASEMLGSADLQVDLSAASGLTIMVDYTVTGTASGSGSDYSLADGTLTIAAGNVNDNITIASIVNDLLDENNETVIVTLSSPSNASLGTNTVHTYTINDNDATPTLAFNATSSNASETLGSADLQVDLSAVSGLTITVDYTVTGTASGSGIDYSLADGTLTLAAGDVNKNITIASIVNDLLDENNETVILTLSNPTNAILGTNTVHTYTINDNDASPTIAFNGVSSNASEALGNADLQVDLSAVSGLTITVDYMVTGTASGSGTDYSLADGTLTLAAGDVNKNITIASIVNDLLDENNETVILTLSNPTNAILGTNTVHTYTINDNDASPTIAFNAVSSNGSEALGSADLQVDLSAASGLTVTVDYTVTGTASGSGTDYTLADGTLTIGAGDINDNITIASIVNDLLDENNETVIVMLSSPTNASLGTNTTHTFTINDNDATPTVSLSVSKSELIEDGGSCKVTATLSAISSKNITAFLDVSGDAIHTIDYFVSNNRITIAPGNLTGFINGTVIQDNLVESNETINVFITHCNNVIEHGEQKQTITIIDDDVAGITISETGGGTTVLESGTIDSFAVALSAQPLSDVVFDITNPDNGEVVSSLNQLTFTNANWNIAQTITLTGVNDNIDDGDQNTVVTLSVDAANSDDAFDNMANKTVTVITTDDDHTPVIIASQALSVDENKANGSNIGAIMATDSDPGTTFSDWTIVSGNTNNVFAINVSSGQLTVNDGSQLDYESITNYTLGITVSDGTNISASQNIFIDVMNVNDNTPLITANQTFIIHENLHNGNSFATILAIDKDHDAVLNDWKIISGNESNAFSLNSTFGQIIVNSSNLLDREETESFKLTLSVSDGIHVSIPEVIIIYLDDLNDNLPIVIPNQSFTIDENSNVNASIGNVLASDADITQTKYNNWTITNMVDYNQNGNHAVAIDPNSGELTVNDPDDFNYESNSSFNVKIKVADGTGFSAEEVVVINLKDVNEFAPIITAGQTFSLNEDVNSNTIIGVLKATDEDANYAFSNWKITGGNEAALFQINADNGEVSLIDDSELDYEKAQTYILSVTVTDGEYLSEVQNASVNVINVNEAPIAIAGENQVVAKNSEVVLNAEDSNDPENDMLTYKWSAPDGIELSDITSVMPTFKAPEVNVLTDYIFTLVVNDGELSSEEVSVTISVDNVTGIDDLDSDVFKVSLYPNPSRGSFFLELNSRPLDYSTVRIINLSGKLVHSQKVYEKKNYFNLSLKSGMYLLKVEHENNRSVKKIIIQ